MERHLAGLVPSELLRCPSSNAQPLRASIAHRASCSRSTIARHRGVALEQAVPEHAVPEHALVTAADVTMLKQAVSNTVYNAIRHNRTNGHVAVIVEPIAARRFRIRVIDDGPGIPAADLSRVMERGQRRGDACTRDPEGRGLGLGIVHRAAALQMMTTLYTALRALESGSTSPTIC